jgi:hypothetical protein
MRPARIITAVVFAAAIAVTGCAAHPTAAPAPSEDVMRPITPIVRTGGQTPTPPKPAAGPKAQRLHFATPEASMRYLAAAYNRNDVAALKHVTTPQARNNLLFMRPNADNLRLVSCTANAGRGDYSCAFTHGYPAAMHQAGTGHAHFTIAPADRVGWYMTVLDDCG